MNRFVLVRMSALVLLATAISAFAKEPVVPIQPVEPETVGENGAEKNAGSSKADLFGTAIILISLGGMCAASSLHFTAAERKRMESQIADLEGFVGRTCCVVRSSPASHDIEAGRAEIHRMEAELERELERIREWEKRTLDDYAGAEGRLLRRTWR